MSKDFDKKKLSALNYLLNEIKPDKRHKTLQNAKKQIKLNETENSFNKIITAGEDLFFRIGVNKGHIKAKKEFETTRDNAIHFLNDKIKEILQLKTQIELKNRLISELFIRKEKSLIIAYKDLRHNQLIYFRQPKITDYYGSDNKNMGRIKKGKKWEDHRLSLITHYFKNYEEISELEEYPLYKVLNVKKSYIELQNLNTKNIIKLIHNRQYTPYILFTHNQYIPRIKKTSQTNLNTFSLKEVK